MRQESVIRELVKSYLVELGYPESGMTLEVRTREGRVADLVVHDQDGPRVVVEVKSGKRFPVDKEPSRLRFDPYVRQLQSFAVELGAPYYLLTDGVSFLWFTTDDSGRPQLLDSPVPPTPGAEAVSLPPSREAISGVLGRLRDLFVRRGTVVGDTEMAFAILAKLLSELGDNRLRETLVTVGDEDLMLLPSVTISPRDLRSRKHLPEALDILDTVQFRDAVPQDVLGALDETLFRTMTRRQPQVPRWLADFLVCLGQLQPHAVVLDICTGYGNILAAVSQPQREVHPISVWGISRDVKSALWAIIQQVILGLPEDRVFVGESPPYDIRDGRRIPRPTHIIAAPPFGGRVDRLDTASALFSQGVFKLEDLYLELAIEWVQPQGRVVMIVPEALLFTGGKTKVTREVVRERTRISAIISLPSGALLPYSGVKTSILVLDKKPSSRPYEVFMSHIEDIRPKDISDSRDIPGIAKALNEFEEWTRTHRIESGSISWTAPIGTLRIDNFTAIRYLPSDLSGYEELFPSYPLVPLKQVAKLTKRGVRIKLDEEGNLPVIGPGAIRPMILDASNIESTTEDNLPSRPVTVEAGDIVLNNIGMHLGSVAVIDEDVAGSYISQHVLLIRPDTSQILPEYLAAAMNSDYVRPQIERRATGSIMPALSVSRLTDITIPLPDLATQQRIVAAIVRARDDLAQKREQLERAEARFEDMIRRLSSGIEVEE